MEILVIIKNTFNFFKFIELKRDFTINIKKYKTYVRYLKKYV